MTSTSGWRSCTNAATESPIWLRMRRLTASERTRYGLRGSEAVQRERVEVAEPAVHDHEQVLRGLDEVHEPVAVDPAVLLHPPAMPFGPPRHGQLGEVVQLG